MSNERNYIFSIIAGILLILNTLVFSIVEIQIPFLGVYSINFFKGLANFTSFSKEIKNISNMLIFSGILLLIIALGFIYSGIKKNRAYIKYLTIANIVFLVIFYFALFKKIPNDIRRFVSFSLFKNILYIISLLLAIASYTLTKIK